MPWLRKLALHFTHLLALLLWAGAALAWVGGMQELSVAIVGVVAINGIFSYWQEHEAERAVEELEAMLPRQVMLRRDGHQIQAPAAEVVPGDLLLLQQGEAIPADARLIQANRLRLDTSAMTGESRPVARSEKPVSGANGLPSVSALPNLVLAGTTVVSGLGEAVVFATGGATEFGRIAKLTGHQRERPSPLEKELRHVTGVVTIFAVAMGCVFFVTGQLLGELSFLAAFLFAVGIIVANVPEGLLPTVTLALAMGVRRMASRRALVKRLSAVEALGATTLILTDKTGTLTENRMAVHQLWAEGQWWDPQSPASPADLHTEALLTAALCCDAPLGDPTEIAILSAAATRFGLTDEHLARYPRLGELPFDSVRKRMTTLQAMGGHTVACVKGAPSEVLPRCLLDTATREQSEAAQRDMAGRRLRVLAVARRDLGDLMPSEGDGWRPEQIEHELTFLGLIGLEDPPRKEVAPAIAACRAAGIRVIMSTGDDGLTAAAIGQEIGLHASHPHIITGAHLDTLHEDAIDRLFDEPELLFARVSPEHKLRLVESCQRRGEVVAVTGDGVNDAPALKRADIGVAMGETGTDVAREAADVVLTDDNFASIVAAIEEGRAVYDNVRKFVTYIFASNVPEIVPFIAFVLLRIPLPLTIMQVLAVDLGTDLVPALALGAEPAEPGVMQRPPRKRGDRLLDRGTLFRAYAWLGVIEAALAMTAFFAAYWMGGWRPGEPLPETGPLYQTATTMTLAGIVACQIGNLFACRTRLGSSLGRGLPANRLLFAGLAFELLLLLALIYFPPLADVFGLAPLEAGHWLLLASFGPILLLLEETRKAVMRRNLR
jgi:calcium-translocating P-type ATPase